MDYKETVLLPQTAFPMRAELPKREPGILDSWRTMDLYGQLRRSAAGRPRYVLHDGPPYANGHIHMGHAINKVLKDVIVKSRQMSGFDANYVPGWDCHGLPIELMAEKEFKKQEKGKHNVDLAEFRQACRDFAAHWLDTQRNEFIRLGVVGDWQHPYLTMDYRFEADTVRELGRFLLNGGLYKGTKPVYWCAHDVTALAEAEVEYEDHTSTTIFVKFPLSAQESLVDAAPELAGIPNERISVVIWTTTPWTIPGNLAVCLNATLTYVALRADGEGAENLQPGEVLILAEGLWEATADAMGLPRDKATVLARFPGKAIEGKRFTHPYLEQFAPIVLGDHVTLEAGTGCVHTAPGHGYEDYVTGRAYGLSVFNPVDDHGRFVPGTPHVEGMNTGQANVAVVELLRREGRLLAERKLTHSYPHCWPVAARRFDEAAVLLGRPFELEGRVVSGRQRGRTMGFPTANMDLGGLLHPPPGVYVVEGQVEEDVCHGLFPPGRTGWLPGVANLGVNPTFGHEGLHLEVHFLSGGEDLYHRILRLRFVAFLREETRFADTDALTRQIAEDVNKAREILGL